MPSLATESLFWGAAAVCALAEMAIVRGAIVGVWHDRRSGSPPGNVEGTVGGDRRRPRTAGELAWALLPGIVLALVLVWTWRTMHPASAPGHAPAPPALSAPSSGA